MTSHIAPRPETSHSDNRGRGGFRATQSRSTRAFTSGRSLKFTLCTFALVIAGVCGLQAQSPVGQPEITPKFVELNKATQVTVTSRIDDPNLIRTSVKLQWYDAGNSMWRDVGMMNDDGKNGDLKAGDKVFTWQGNLTVNDKTNPMKLRVVAMLNGMKNVQSQEGTLTGVKELLKKYTPKDIKDFFKNNGDVRSAAAFLQRLNPDDGFKHDWIMITDTRSAQKADASHPRIILQNSIRGDSTAGSGSTAVFGVGTLKNKDVIEYIQWDSDNNRFRFHEINAATGTVDENDETCNRCHGPKTEGTGKKEWPYPRPNWDAYDSWGGALPFNRDRVYIARRPNDIEPRAIQRLLKDLAADPVVSQLDLPEGMARADDGSLIITADSDDGKTDVFPVKYQKQEDDGGKLTGILFPGDQSSKADVQQGGPFLVMHHLGKGLDSDEGRAVALFDNYSALNAQRVAQELKDKFDKEGVQYVDIRPVALAIAGGGTDGPCDVASGLDQWGGNALNALETYFSVKNLDDLAKDTHQRRAKLPQIKAQQEAGTLIDLMSANGDTVTADAIVHQVAQRSDQGIYKVDELTPFMIDREDYSDDNTISLFRLFLEPSHEPVDLWSLSLYSTRLAPNRQRSDTYTFGDIFKAILPQPYLQSIRDTLGGTTFGAPGEKNPSQGKDKSCAELQKDSKAWFDLAIKDHPNYFKK
jgi:hypothetical protein